MPENNTQEPNPFEPPPVVETPRANGLGAGYWLPMAGLVGFLIIALLLTFRQGREEFWVALALALVPIGFAAYHGFLYNRRLKEKWLAGESFVRRPDWVIFLISASLGMFGAVAGSIAFVATCVPTSILAVEAFPSNGIQRSVPSMVFMISMVSFLIAVVAVGFLLRFFVPRKPTR